MSTNIDKYQIMSRNINNVDICRIKLPNITKYHHLSTNINKYRQILTDIDNVDNCRQMLTNMDKYWIMSTNINKCRHMSTNVEQNHQISPFIDKYWQNGQISTDIDKGIMGEDDVKVIFSNEFISIPQSSSVHTTKIKQNIIVTNK